MKIARFKKLGTSSPWETIKGPEWEEIGDDYVRISEYVEVEFPPLNSDEVVQKQLTALDNAETELRNRFQAALVTIDQQRQELRAITYRAD